MVMIAGNHQHGDLHRSDRAAGGRDRGLGGPGRIEEISRDQDELRLASPGGFGDPREHGDALLLEDGAFGGVRHPGEGFVDLPVGGVEEGWHFGGSIQYLVFSIQFLRRAFGCVLRCSSGSSDQLSVISYFKNHHGRRGVLPFCRR